MAREAAKNAKKMGLCLPPPSRLRAFAWDDDEEDGTRSREEREEDGALSASPLRA
jgi:hypothetical protein